MKNLITVFLMLVGSAALAKPYGDAGCGLGSIVFGDQGGFTQVFAATLNGTGVQTFGITTGTSNCTDGGAMKGAKAIPAFIEVNKVALAKDAARGEGETLAGLANLLGCNSKNLGQTLQSNYNKIFVETNMEPSDIEAGINNTISSNKSQACGA
jgi:hypothetical protein